VPTNRRFIQRHRRPVFSVEVLDLFQELERVRNPRSEVYRDKSLRLAQLLNLTNEWWCSVTDVNERSSGPSHPPGYIAFDAWHKVRAVRIELLQAVRERRAARKLEAVAEPSESAPAA
jgi:hypothetical protein